MELSVAVRLIEKGVSRKPGEQVWADLGAGSGLFTLALSGLLPPGSTVYAVDRNASALAKVEIGSKEVAVRKVHKDFVVEDTGLPALDGLLMANALHFVKDKLSLLKMLKNKLKSTGRIILVEYDMERSNPWVPHPISFAGLEKLVGLTGFASAVRLDEEPSRYNRANMYSVMISVE